MKTTPNLGLKKPDGTDVVDVTVLNGNADVLDTEVAKLASTTEPGRMSAADKTKLNGIAAGANNYTHPSSHPASIIAQDSSNRFVTDAEKAVWNAKATTAAATTSANGLMSAADKAKLDGVAAGAGTAGSATDTVIGSRTIADTSAPTGDSGTVTTLLGWVGNMIKSITGKSSWRTAPATSLEAAKSHMDAVSAHGATSTATASRIMMRDASGRAQVVAPSAAADIANKGYVDGAVSGIAVPDASTSVKGKVQLSSAVNSTSEALAATSASVKAAYDRGSAGVSAAATAQSTASSAQARATAALPKDGSEPMTGPLLIYGFGTNGLTSGNGDMASYTAHNFRLHGHYGMGMETYDGSVNGYYDFRAGKWDVKDGYYVNGTKIPQMRENNGALEFFSGGAWKQVGGIKSVQRGIATLNGRTTVNITISAVNMSKAVESVSYCSDYAATGGVRARLTSATNLELYSDATTTAHVAWVVAEY